MMPLNCHRLGSNEVRLGLSLIAYKPGNPCPRLVLPERIDNRSPTSLQQRFVKTVGPLDIHAHY